MEISVGSGVASCDRDLHTFLLDGSAAPLSGDHGVHSILLTVRLPIEDTLRGRTMVNVKAHQGVLRTDSASNIAMNVNNDL
jgi:hypothetical protein